MYGNTEGEPATEASALNPIPLIAWRPVLEQRAQALAARRSIATVILRPTMVHGYGGGIFGMRAGMVRQPGSVRVVSDGPNHWPAVHVDDLATAYLSAVERLARGDGRVAGQIFNVVADDFVALPKWATRFGPRSAPTASNFGRSTTLANRLSHLLTHWRSTIR